VGIEDNSDVPRGEPTNDVSTTNEGPGGTAQTPKAGDPAVAEGTKEGGHRRSARDILTAVGEFLGWADLWPH
jgi:hypothetical protein